MSLSQLLLIIISVINQNDLLKSTDKLTGVCRIEIVGFKINKFKLVNVQGYTYSAPFGNVYLCLIL